MSSTICDAASARDEELDAQRITELMHLCTFDQPDLATGMQRLLDVLATSDTTPNEGAATTSAAEAGTPKIAKLAPDGHSSVVHGGPWLRCSSSWGLVLLREVDSSNQALGKITDDDDEQTVWVEWDPIADRQDECSLVLRRNGELVNRSDGVCGKPLSLKFGFERALPGEVFVAELCWPTGSRHLHILAPVKLGSLKFTNLVTVPGAVLRPRLCRHTMASLPERGFGVEVEVITVGEDLDTRATEWHKMLHTIASESEAAGDPELAQMLMRCDKWDVTRDSGIMPSPLTIAKQMVEASSWIDQSAVAQVELGLRLLQGTQGTVHTEFKSPPPPNELSFAKEAADELAVLMDSVAFAGAGAPTLTRECYAGSTFHVHVNVVNPSASGYPLLVDEILAVFLHWVRFDLITFRFARPWIWQERSAAPLYASGTEISWSECAWDPSQRMPHTFARAAYDVPSFLSAVKSIRDSLDFKNLPEAEQLALVFGPGSPARALGRFCSLNLCRISSYGTIEFRRFHAPLNACASIRWSHFCVCFVEVFCSQTAIVADVLEASLAEGLAKLRSLQETASISELFSQLSGGDFHEYMDLNVQEDLLKEAGCQTTVLSEPQAHM